MALIAEIVGCQKSTVHAVLSGNQTAKSYLGERIVKTAKELLTRHLEMVEELKEKYNSGNPVI